jgi:hypothetical protein
VLLVDYRQITIHTYVYNNDVIQHPRSFFGFWFCFLFGRLLSEGCYYCSHSLSLSNSHAPDWHTERILCCAAYRTAQTGLGLFLWPMPRQWCEICIL